MESRGWGALETVSLPVAGRSGGGLHFAGIGESKVTCHPRAAVPIRRWPDSCQGLVTAVKFEISGKVILNPGLTQYGLCMAHCRKSQTGQDDRLFDWTGSLVLARVTVAEIFKL